jgi:hypothetical protein
MTDFLAEPEYTSTTIRHPYVRAKVTFYIATSAEAIKEILNLLLGDIM